MIAFNILKHNYYIGTLIKLEKFVEGQILWYKKYIKSIKISLGAVI